MTITRRDFLHRSSLLAGAMLTHQAARQAPAVRARPVLNLAALPPFVDALPIPPVARSTESRTSPANPALKIPYFRIPMKAFDTQIHRGVQPTRMWGFSSVFPGPTFDVRSGQEILVEWVNELPPKHFLPIDHTLGGAGKNQPEVRAVVHLHGAKAPPESDGYPEDWIVPGKSALYHYPNQQDAAMLWYHDHAMGINRLNIFAGLVGSYILRDSVEDALHLPSGKYEIPLVICDRMFDKDGQLYYPVSDDPGAPWIPEFFGDAYLVNGKLLPFLDVEPRQYRFRVLNASNGRFYRLLLSNKQSFHAIGTDQGLLDAPVQLKKIVIAPGERLDLLVDFSAHAGEKIVVQDDVLPIMQFRVAVAAAAPGVQAASVLPPLLRPVPKLAESSAVKTRMLSLDEIDDLVQNPVRMLLNGSRWDAPVTENPLLDTTEIWTLINPTDDSHPIHLHLVRFQIRDRRRFQTFAYLTQREIKFTGPAVPPDPAEAGWKDTVRAEPGMVTRIIVHFEGYAGRYVWHCHILEHEDNEMMRPYQVLPHT
ncbi:MAG: multicopper oxidase [Candidatus Acidiferrales bacterium]